MKDLPISTGGSDQLERARRWALDRAQDSHDSPDGSVVEHAEGVASILRNLGADEIARAAAYLIDPPEAYPVESIAKDFGSVIAHIVGRVRQADRVSALIGDQSGESAHQESLRRMLLAMADDIRVVLLCLASRLQRLRWHAQNRAVPSVGMSEGSLRIFAPLANRLGLWQIKWEMEDLSFRFLQPELYRSLARQLESRRVEREAFVENAIQRVQRALSEVGVRAQVYGRPKHLYSIHSKMVAKGRRFDEINDLRALRVIVQTVGQCYIALDAIHSIWSSLADEYDDYIARPKPNGYRSLHTVVVAHDGQTLEVQIRTHEMHEFAEYGVASHWRYKEAGTGTVVGGASALSAEQSVAWVRQLLAWQREVGLALGSSSPDAAPPSAHLYALTPQGRVIELPLGATPVDFAYHVHSALGHRCRGARVDGQLVPLNRPLQTGQTVEIIVAKEGAGEGPSRDWLNPGLAYVVSARARSKVRQWFAALELSRELSSGRDRVERVLQREGKTGLSFDELARRLGQIDVSGMFLAVARDEIGPRQLEEAARGSGSSPSPSVESSSQLSAPDGGHRSPRVSQRGSSAVLVVGEGALLNQLARCCRPVPPDPVIGFVTRGRGVSVHRQECSSFLRLAQASPERVIETAWDSAAVAPDSEPRRFPVDIEVRAHDRQGLLRDVSDVMARDRINVIGVSTHTRNQEARMRFTLEVADGAQVTRTLVALRRVTGVSSAMRL